MKLLLDTHIWLWALTTPERVHEGVRSAIADPRTDIVLSAASAWELAIKHAAGKLALASSTAELVEVSIRALRLRLLPIEVEHALLAASLPRHHNDPFDRMLIAQSRLAGLTLVTADVALREYGDPLLWAI